MSIFKEAVKAKIRFNTKQGLLSTEQLFELSLTRLAIIVRNLKKEISKDSDDELSFLDETSKPVDATAQLRFDVAKAIYLDKKAERDAIQTSAAKKEHNEKILALIAKKQEGELEGKSVKELTDMLQD